MNANDAMQIMAGLGIICVGVAGVYLSGKYLAGRDQAADEHDVADYQRPAARHTRPEPPDTRPPLDDDTRPAGQRATSAPGRWIFAETATAMGMWPADAGAVVAVVASRYGDSPADRAARMLREIAAEQRGLAVAR